MSDKRRLAIIAEIKALGPVLSGSIVERSTRCQRSGCHCRADPPVLHGPYVTWMHQQEGRQVTKTLSAEEAELLRPMLAAGRRLRELVRELEDLGVTDLVESGYLSPLPVGNRRPKAGK